MNRMRIRTVFAIDCPAEVAWAAAHTPATAAELYRPLLTMTARHGVLPARFESGDRVDVALRMFGALPAGSQRIAIEDVLRDRFPAGSRTMRDAGRPLTGPLALLRGWNHEITVWRKGRGTAVWHDELTITGGFAPLFSLVLGPMWLWRRAKLRRLARGWRDSHFPSD